jgi:uncharacterized protein (DUF1778 family)
MQNDQDNLYAQEIKTEIVYSAEQWDDFCAMLDRPARYLPRLQKLMSEPSLLEKF